MLQQEKSAELAKAFEEQIHILLQIKARLPFLLALAEELARIGADKPVRNDIVLKIANDSFDLMVIDLASLREGMTNGDDSTLNRLAQHARDLRRLQPEDCDPNIKMAVGDAYIGPAHPVHSQWLLNLSKLHVAPPSQSVSLTQVSLSVWQK